MFTKGIQKKIQYRENLLREYKSNIHKMQNAKEKTQNELNAATDQEDFQTVPKKELELEKASAELALVARSFDLTQNNLGLSPDFIRSEWDSVPMKVYRDRRAKADAALEKAYAAFVEAIYTAAKVGTESYEEADDWRRLICSEDKTFNPCNMSFINSYAGVANPHAIFREYAIKFSMEQPEFRI